MSASLNRWQGIGNLGGDPDIRFTQSGAAVASFSIACNEKWKDKDSGEDKERVEWVRLSAFGRQAEIAGEYLKKGNQIYAEGRLQTRKWTDNDGIERYTTEVVVSRFLMLGQKGGGNRPPHPADQQQQQEEKTASPQGDFDDDIPF